MPNSGIQGPSQQAMKTSTRCPFGTLSPKLWCPSVNKFSPIQSYNTPLSGITFSRSAATHVPPVLLGSLSQILKFLFEDHFFLKPDPYFPIQAEQRPESGYWPKGNEGKQELHSRRTRKLSTSPEALHGTQAIGGQGRRGSFGKGEGAASAK